MSNVPKPLVLLILDGFGYSTVTENNAIALANTPCWDKLSQENPMTLLDCSGEVVGLPDAQMGNSEVGHLHIGSGRFVPQDLSRVTIAIRDGEFFENVELCKAIDHAKQNDKALHVMGLLSPGGVHSHEQHILAMLEMAAKRGLKKIYLHAILDGRDVPPKSAASSIQLVQDKFDDLGAGCFASVSGRFYAMDRDSRWDRVEVAHRLIAKGESEFQAKTAAEALEAAYQRDEMDEFVMPTAIVGESGASVVMDPEDSVVFMNFRADRAREISRALTEEGFSEFDRGCQAHKGPYVTLTEYHQSFDFPIAFPSLEVNNCLGEVLANHGMKQLRLAETEKYAHVTFFLNGGRDEPFVNEDRILVPSPKVKTYDMQPEMCAGEVTDHLVEAISGGKYEAVICNYANCDMVGHTGNLDAAIVAVETIDASLKRIVEALESVGGAMLITADHGNIEKMRDDESGQAHTAHTTNKVPLVLVGGKGAQLADGGSLSDLAPTMLDILNIDQPVEMTGRSLIASK